MSDSTVSPERARAQAAGLERFLRRRLLNVLTRLFLALVLIGGTISALTPGSHALEVAAICLAVAAVFAAWFSVLYLKAIRGLRTDPVHEVARLHRKRSIQKAGFVDVPTSPGVPSQTRERTYSDVAENDAYGALNDIDVLGQKSDDGVNRTDDPSRGPIE